LGCFTGWRGWIIVGIWIKTATGDASSLGCRCFECREARKWGPQRKEGHARCPWAVAGDLAGRRLIARLGLGRPARPRRQAIFLGHRRSGCGRGSIGCGGDQKVGPWDKARQKKFKSAFSGLSLPRGFGLLAAEPIQITT